MRNDLSGEYLEVLERIAAGAPLAELLRAILVHVEHRAPHLRCAIELEEPAGPEVGGWATPIRDAAGEPLGTLLLTCAEPRAPTPDERAAAATGAHLAALAVMRDRQVRALQASEARAQQLARLYGLSSSVNEAILRIRQPEALYEVACRLAVEHDLAQLAWVGVLDDSGVLVPVARAGRDDGYIDAIRLRSEDACTSNGPGGRALRSGQPALANDIANDPAFCVRPQAAARGLRACAAFPLKRAGKAYGLLVLYAEQVGYFCEEEVRVLDTLAQDISFAVEAARVAHDEALHALLYKIVGEVIFYIKVEAPGIYRFESVNPAFLNATGVTLAQVVGRRLEEVIPQPQAAVVARHYDEAIAAQRTVTWEETTPYPTGERRSEISVTPRFDPHGVCTHLVGSVHDLTARRRAEDERRAFENQLHQAQRVQALGTLASGIAHDFNNILVAISCNTELLNKQLPAPAPPVRESLDEIQQATRRATKLVRQILAFGRSTPPHREVLDPRPVIEEAVQLLRVSLPSSTELRTRFADRVPRIAADATELHQIVMNLGTNAAHALANGQGVIEISVEPVAPADAGAGCRMRVRDTGSGMDAATLQRAFDPFFTTKPAGEGSGLGLSVVHGIVKNHGGSIDVTSEPGAGTTFDIYLPAADLRAP